MLSVGNELMSSGIKILKIGEGGLFGKGGLFGEGEELYHGRPTIGLQGFGVFCVFSNIHVLKTTDYN